MTNAILQRFHLSGHLAELQPEPLAVVKECVAFYRSIRQRLRHGSPWWPTGLPQPGDGSATLAVADEQGVLLAVWHIRGASPVVIDLEALPGPEEAVELAFSC